LRETCPFKKYSPKYNAASGIIAGELLTRFMFLLVKNTRYKKAKINEIFLDSEGRRRMLLN
jgi:hypothetical protein